MPLPRDHHFVPSFYLKQWCDSNRKLVEYTIKHDKLIAKPVGPDSTGYEFDLYAFPELPPDQSQFIEQKFFDYADRTASEALRLHLTNTSAWNNELISAWSRFIVALHLRHPDMMPELRAAAKAIWEGSAIASQRQYELIKTSQDPERFDEYLAQRDPLASVKARVNLIVKSFDNGIVGAKINQMVWAVIPVASSSHFLLTSDRPVGIFNLNDPTGMITLPISPTKLFIAANDERVIDSLSKKRPREIVGHINTRLVTRARRFVWACDESQSPFIRKHMSTKLEPTPLLPTVATYSDPTSP